MGGPRIVMPRDDGIKQYEKHSNGRRSRVCIVMSILKDVQGSFPIRRNP